MEGELKQSSLCLPLDFDPFWIIGMTWQPGRIIDAIHYMVKASVLSEVSGRSWMAMRATRATMIDRRQAAFQMLWELVAQMQVSVTLSASSGRSH